MDSKDIKNHRQIKSSPERKVKEVLIFRADEA
jgi:hypothetical protein